DDGLHDRRLTQIFRELCLALRPEQLDFADSAIFSDRASGTESHRARGTESFIFSKAQNLHLYLLLHREEARLFGFPWGELDVGARNLESNFVALDVGDGGLQFLTNLEAGLAGPLLGLVLWVLVVLLWSVLLGLVCRALGNGVPATRVAVGLGSLVWRSLASRHPPIPVVAGHA
ncbi:hypothetical protein, partial [Synechococcus sp. R5-12]|uniref:hypothetical protein n=2 Tax=Synechococcus TaxID=1129 RepID=UPI0039C6E9CC